VIGGEGVAPLSKAVMGPEAFAATPLNREACPVGAFMDKAPLVTMPGYLGTDLTQRLYLSEIFDASAKLEVPVVGIGPEMQAKKRIGSVCE